MPNSAATARVDSGRRLHTATISTSATARRPGTWRDRVLAPAPMRPILSMATGPRRGRGRRVDLMASVGADHLDPPGAAGRCDLDALAGLAAEGEGQMEDGRRVGDLML